MSLQHLNLNLLSENHLAELIKNEVGESKTLEFKEAIIFHSDEQKRELLSDISALANSDGGDIIYGIKESKGVASEIVGLRNFNLDDTMGRFENLLRDSIQPRVSGVQMKGLCVSTGNHVFIVRVPKSLSGPHMVRHQGIVRFCGRNSNGKYDLDSHEIKSAFLASDGLSDRLKSFRFERINKLLTDNSSVRLSGRHLIVLHILPVIAARPDFNISTQSLHNLISSKSPCPLFAHNGFTPRLNFDGLLVTSDYKESKFSSFLQITRKGYLESVDSFILEPKQVPNMDNPVGIILDKIWEDVILQVTPKYLDTLRDGLNIPPPYVASISFLNVRGYFFGTYNVYNFFGGGKVDRDHLLTDEILIESTEVSPNQLMKPLFDQIWNSCGFIESPNYNSDGSRKGEKVPKL